MDDQLDFEFGRKEFLGLQQDLKNSSHRLDAYQAYSFITNKATPSDLATLELLIQLKQNEMQANE